MKNNMFYGIFLLALLFSSGLCAQQPDSFLEEAGINAAIFRGAEAEKYNFKYQETPYAYSETFLLGTLKYNDVEYVGLLLNVNSHKDELHLKVEQLGKVLELDKRLVEKFTIGNRKFELFMGETAVEGLEDGFYEILYRGHDMLVKKNVRKYNERLQASGDKGAFRFFDAMNRYYVIKGGTPVKITRMKDIAKVYKEEKKAVKAFIRKNKVRFIDMDNQDMAFMEIMAFVDNN